VKADNAEFTKFYKYLFTLAISYVIGVDTKFIAIFQMIEHIRLSLTADQLVEYSQRDAGREKQLFTQL